MWESYTRYVNIELLTTVSLLIKKDVSLNFETYKFLLDSSNEELLNFSKK